MNVYEKLQQVQSVLKAPKGQYNSFGKYAYRSCEDILEGLKPCLAEVRAVVMITDTVEQIGDRFYVKATATFIDTEKPRELGNIEVSAYAREDETKKGMDLAQVTGSVSSYARKYALNGLFCIDDTKDSDATNTHGKENKPQEKQFSPNVNATEKAKQEITMEQIQRLYAIASSKGYNTERVKGMMTKKYNVTSSKELTKLQYEELASGFSKLPDKVGE